MLLYLQQSEKSRRIKIQGMKCRRLKTPLNNCHRYNYHRPFCKGLGYLLYVENRELWSVEEGEETGGEGQVYPVPLGHQT